MTLRISSPLMSGCLRRRDRGPRGGIPIALRTRWPGCRLLTHRPSSWLATKNASWGCVPFTSTSNRCGSAGGHGWKISWSIRTAGRMASERDSSTMQRLGRVIVAQPILSLTRPKPESTPIDFTSARVRRIDLSASGGSCELSGLTVRSPAGTDKTGAPSRYRNGQRAPARAYSYKPHARLLSKGAPT